MITIRKSTNILLAALALGGASLAVAGEASAGPRYGHGHGFHRYHGPHYIWGGHYGPRFVHYGGGYRCRLVRRVNHYGEIRVRRICFNPYL